MKRALRIGAMTFALIAALVLTGCSLLQPTYVPYNGSMSGAPAAESSSTKAESGSTNGQSVPVPTTKLVPVSGEPVLGTPVDIVYGIFTPGRVYIKIGATVTWVNHDSASRNVTGNGFASGTIAPGGRFSAQFNRAGTYPYYSFINPDMFGEVMVR